MSKIGIIIGREYSTRVRKKSFLVATFLVPILMAAMMVVPFLIATFSTDKQVRDVAVADYSGIVAPNLNNSQIVNYHIIDTDKAEELKKDIAASEYYALVQISQLDSANNAKIAIYSDEQVSLPLKESIEHNINNILTENKLRSYNIVDLDKVIANINNSSRAKTYQTTDSGEQKESLVGVYMGVGYISSFIIYFFILMFGGMVMQGVIEEKNNRIIEVIVSSVKPIEIMMGKIIGIALVALTQFVAWIALTSLIVFGVSMVAGGKGNDRIMQQAVEAHTEISTIPGMEQDVPTLSGMMQQEQSEQDSSDEEMLSSIVSALGQLNITAIIGTFILFFILGYLLYASMYAAVGAAVDNQADTQQLVMPITIPLIAGLFIMLSAFQNPQSSLAVWGSIIPFTSPMVMVARVAYGVPAWQYILSVALLIGTFLFIGWVSSKIYRVGILSYGKKASWKDLFKWLKFKD